MIIFISILILALLAGAAAVTIKKTMIDKDGNNTPGYYVTEEDDQKTIHPLP